MANEKVRDEIFARFKHYTPANHDEIRVHEAIREACKNAAINLIVILPETVVNSREFSQALTDLETP